MSKTRLGQGLVLLLGFLATASVAAWYSWPRRAEGGRVAMVVSGSMAPAILGPHNLILCDDCGCRYACSTEQNPTGWPYICPLCGKAQTFPEFEPLRGDRVQIDNEAFAEADPERWSMVAFRRTVDGQLRWEVKRVVGLPGESVTIRDGDILIDDKRRVAKTLEEALSMAVLVHDSRFVSSDETLPKRWTTEKNPDNDAQTVMTYHHWRCVNSPLPREEAVPIMDSYGVNQALSRELNPIRDLIVECQLRPNSDGIVTFRLLAAGHQIEGKIDRSESKLTLIVDGSARESKAFTPGVDDIAYLAHLDGQAIFTVGESSLRFPLDEIADWKPVASPLQILLERCEPELVGPVRLYRDLHYLGPDQRSDPWSTNVGPNDYLVLGDNAPVSSDSREFGAVARENIVGAVSKVKNDDAR